MSEFPLWLSLIIKVAFAATVVVSATVLAEKSGPLVAGLIIAMPISVGPTYIMLAFTTPPRFIADSALGTIAANAAVAAFGTVYVLLARRMPMPVSLSLALSAWFAMALMEQRWDPAPGVLVAFSTTMLVAGSIATRRALAGRKLLVGAKRWFDLPLRAAFVGLFAGALVTISHLIGPGWTGLLAAFPLVLTTSIVLMHPRVGAPATAAVIATAVQGLVIYPCAFSVLYLYAPTWGAWWAMLVCLMVIVLWAGLVYFWRTLPMHTAG